MRLCSTYPSGCLETGNQNQWRKKPFLWGGSGKLCIVRFTQCQSQGQRPQVDGKEGRRPRKADREGAVTSSWVGQALGQGTLDLQEPRQFRVSVVRVPCFSLH